MQRRLPSTLLNPVSLLGAIMAVFALVIVLVLLFLGATGTIANPYTGILTFLLGPLALALGLILIPIGSIREQRRLARLGLVAKVFPVLDLNEPRQRRGLAVFAAVTAGILSLMAVTTYGAAEFMESREFCGDVCHRVMEPEGAAYEASPHARVTCVSCHIGPGAPWLVKSKISGLRQVFNYTFDRYERPVEVPIKDLRPSRDTCEQCHWPERFYGDKLRPYIHFSQDEQNTMRSQPLVFRVGGSEQGEGIHWHTTAKVWYLPLNEDRSEIGWVKVERPDGSVDEYISPDKKDQVTPERIANEERFMDCIDCHNRAAHHFAPIAAEVDKAMAQGTISPSIPFIKQQVMQALGDISSPPSQQQYQETLQRIDNIQNFYRTQQPQVFTKQGSQIRQAVAEVKSIYRRSAFPDMKLAPGVYPDWAGHDGCMRCHGKLVGTTGQAGGKTIGANCLNCHYPVPIAPAAPASAFSGVGPSQALAQPILPASVPHPTEGRDKCAACHTIGGPGVGTRGGLGIPGDHQGRGDSSCLGCHVVASASIAPTSAAAPPTAASSGASGAPQASPVTSATSPPAPAATVPAAPPAAPSATAAAPAAPPAAAPAAPPTAAAPAAPTTPPATAAPPPKEAPAQVAGPPKTPHPTEGREQCTTCHTVGGPGLGSSGGLGIPANHQGRPDATCVACHARG